jgi:hypothetical protein
MYVLDSRLQAGQKIDKWESRARLAVYIGNSMNHAANVGLALSLTTGLVSPAFHAKYDDGFATVAQSYGRYVPESQWQLQCGVIDDQFLPNREDTTTEGVVGTMTPSNDIAYAPVDNAIDHPSGQEISQHKPRTEAVTAPEPLASKPDVPLRTTRSGRVSKKPTYLQDYVGYETSIFDDTSYDFTEGVLMMSTIQDTLYFHEILREPDKMDEVRNCHAGRDQKPQR